MSADATLELAVRRARLAAAIADPDRTTTTLIAAMAAGSGAEMVARQHRAREALATRLAKRDRDRDHVSGGFAK